MFTVYAIQSLSTERIYIGQTKDLDKRLQYHNLGYVKSTSKNRPWKLLAFAKVKSLGEARWIERKLKKSRGRKIKWIEENRLTKIGYAPEGREKGDNIRKNSFTSSTFLGGRFMRLLP